MSATGIIGLAVVSALLCFILRESGFRGVKLFSTVAAVMLFASAAGTLGVEGMSREVLERVLKPFAVGTEQAAGERPMLTTSDMYELGLTGADNSAILRDRVAQEAALPRGMSAKALLSALNILYSRDEAIALIEKLI